LHKLIAQIHEDKLEAFEAWFASEFAGQKDAYTVESFEPDPNSSAVLYAVSFKIGRQADVDALEGYLAGIGEGPHVQQRQGGE
jgi:hypothetical protein